MEFKLNIGDPKTTKTHKRVIKDDDCRFLLGKKIGDHVKGDTIGLEGYEFEISGGSDYCGFPMRKDVEGSMRKRILIAHGVGIRPERKGIRLRKAVAGNTIYSRTSQINLKIIKHGKALLAEAKAEGEAAESTPEGHKKTEAAEHKKEHAKEEKKEEHKKEEKKEEHKHAKEEKHEKEHAKEEKHEHAEQKEHAEHENPAEKPKHAKEEKKE